MLKKFIPLLLFAVTVAVNAGSFRGDFVFDDTTTILGNDRIHEAQSAVTGSSRPLVALTFHLNHRVGAHKAADYHLVNLLLHVAAGLFLYGVIRRTLLLPAWRGRLAGSPEVVGGVAAAIWLLHPLQTESVTYISQRAESMMGMFYLATMYGFVRGATEDEGPATRTCLAGSVLACALGMFCKPVMVTAPLMVVLFHRVFLAVPEGGTRRLRRAYYVALWMTLLIPLVLVLLPNESSGSAGFGEGSPSSWQYFLTQQAVVLHYFRLTFWPAHLCLDYAWPLVSRAADVWLPLAVNGVLLALAAWGIVKRMWWGFCGVWVWITLLPASSVIPLADAAAEHRMYLPLAGIVVLGVVGAAVFMGRSTTKVNVVFAVLAVAAIAGFAAGTVARNRDYESSERMLRNIVDQRPDNLRARVSLVSTLMAVGNRAEAETVLAALRKRVDAVLKTPDRFPDSVVKAAAFYRPITTGQWANLLLAKGLTGEAIEVMESSPGVVSDPILLQNWAVALFADGQNDRAEAICRRAIALDGSRVRSHTLLGMILERAGRPAEAAAEYRAAVRLGPEDLDSRLALAWLLATCPDAAVRHGADALRLATELCAASEWRSVRALDTLAAALAESGRFDEAATRAGEALALAEQKELEARDRPFDFTPEEFQRRTAQVQEIWERVQLYQEKAPYRETAPPKR